MYVVAGWGRSRKDSVSICLANCQPSGLQGTYIAPKSTHQTLCPLPPTPRVPFPEELPAGPANTGAPADCLQETRSALVVEMYRLILAVGILGVLSS